MVRPSLTRAQREVLDAIVKDTNGGKSWMNPRNLPHWVKNPRQACQILERKGYVESQWIESATCYRPNDQALPHGGAEMTSNANRD